MQPAATKFDPPVTMPRDEHGKPHPPMPNPPNLRSGGLFGVRLLRPSAVDAATGVGMATVSMTVLSIPVLPIRRCRVLFNAAGQPCFFGSVPLRPIDRFAQIAAALAIVLTLYTVATNTANQGRVRFPSGSGRQSVSQERQMPPALAAPAPPGSSSNYYRNKDASSIRQQTLKTLDSDIEAARTEVRRLESQLETMDSELNSLKLTLDGYSGEIETMESNANLGLPVDEYAYRSAVANHNSLVLVYNQKLAERTALYERYKATFERGNQLVNEYNFLIRR